MRIAFLCSGGGGNLKFVWGLTKAGLLDGEVVGVVANSPRCEALRFAWGERIPVQIVEELGPAVLASLAPDVVVSTYHRLIPANVIREFKVINLHYSLLPAFGGKGMMGEVPVRLALERGCTVVGTTVHFVNEGLDEGKIISQTVVPVRSGVEFSELMHEVFRSGCMNLWQALRMI